MFSLYKAGDCYDYRDSLRGFDLWRTHIEMMIHLKIWAQEEEKKCLVEWSDHRISISMITYYTKEEVENILDKNESSQK